MNALHRASIPRRARGLAPLVPVIAIVALAGAVACNSSKAAPPPPPPPVVYVGTVTKQDVSLYIETVGTFDGYVNAEIRARVRGFLQTQAFKDGATVKKGDALFTIEPFEYQTAVASARAGSSRAVANKEHAATQLTRDQGLVQAGVGSQQTLDVSVAAQADALGQVDAASASLRQAQLNLSYTRIQSPIDGVAGIALVRVGNLVGQDGPTLLTTVSQVDPIRVNFSISEVDYVRFPERFRSLDQRDLKWATAQFERLDKTGATDNGDPGIEVTLSDGSALKHRGVIVTVNRAIDPTTGTIALQALLPNPDGFLRPGQYARVRIKRQDEGQGALVVSEKALIPVQGTYSVAVVTDGNKVQLKRVELGPSVRGLRVVTSGVTEGERIVVEGVQKVADGAMVNPKPAPQTVAQAQPSGSATPPGGQSTKN